MRPSAAVHDALAELLEYPRDGHAARARSLADFVGRELPGARADLDAYVVYGEAHDLGECEELYVRTFDGNAERALEVGWQVFGEQYARGAFLVRLREEMRAAGVPETAELPDHLPQVLRLLGRIAPEKARALVESAVVPSLRRVRDDLGESHPFSGVLSAVATAVAAHAAAEAPPSEAVAAAEGVAP